MWHMWIKWWLLNNDSERREWWWWGDSSSRSSSDGDGGEEKKREREKIVACAWLSWTKFRVNAFWPIFDNYHSVCNGKKHTACASCNVYLFADICIEMTWKPFRFEKPRFRHMWDMRISLCVCINLIAIGNLCFFSAWYKIWHLRMMDDREPQFSFCQSEILSCAIRILLSLSPSLTPSFIITTTPPTEPSRNILTVAVKEFNARTSSPHVKMVHFFSSLFLFSFHSINATDWRLGREHCVFSLWTA